MVTLAYGNKNDDYKHYMIVLDISGVEEFVYKELYEYTSDNYIQIHKAIIIDDEEFIYAGTVKGYHYSDFDKKVAYVSKLDYNDNSHTCIDPDFDTINEEGPDIVGTGGTDVHIAFIFSNRPNLNLIGNGNDYEYNPSNYNILDLRSATAKSEDRECAVSTASFDITPTYVEDMLYLVDDISLD